MGLTRAAIAKPFLTALLTVALLLGGIAGWSRMPVDLNPQASLPNVIVTAVYPGAGPSTVETLVAEPMEAAVRGVAGLKHVFSVSQEGFCYLYLEFADGTDVDQAIESCRERVGAIRGDLPDELKEPGYHRLDINAQPVLFLGLVGRRPLGDLRRLAEDRLKPLLEGVHGVAEVRVLGGREPEVLIEVDRERLSANRLTITDLIEPLKASSRNVPGGRLRQAERELGVRLTGEVESLDDLRQVPIPPPADPRAMLSALRPGPAREPVRGLRLGDLATIRRAERQPDVRVRLQQQEAVGLIVTKQGRGNTVQVSRDARFRVLEAGLPEDVEVLVARDTALTVREALADVNASIALGVLLCALTIFVFLRNWRGTLIVAVSMPVCLIGTFAFMSVGGSTINQMTLLGLALSVGILVDDSIVCLEAITYRLHRGEPAAEAAFHGRNDIALADTSTTLIDLAVFVPIAVMHGVVGQFFRDFGFVVATAAALSLLAAYTLVPSLASVWYRHRPPDQGKGHRQAIYAALEARYRGVLGWALEHRWPTLLSGWACLVAAGLAAALALGVDFIPAADLSTVVVNLEMPAGSAEDATEAVAARAEALIARCPDVATLFTTLGRIETGFGVVDRVGPGYAQLNVSLKDRPGLLDRLLLRGFHGRERSDSAVADELREQLAGLGGARWQCIAVHGWGGAGAPVDFSLYGDDLDRLAEYGETILRRLDELPELRDADISWRLGQPELQVRPDRAAARDALVYPGAIGRELRAAVEGETGITARIDGELVPVRLRLRDTDRHDAQDVARIPVGRTAERMLTIGDVATVATGRGPTRIDRRDGQRDLNFKAYLAGGVSLGQARERIEAILADLGLANERHPAASTGASAGITWGWRGDAETLAASAGHMTWTAVVAALLVYLIMAALFNSPVHPLTIMLSVPIAATGALLALVVTGSSLSIVSGIGLILLLGIVVRNAILLIDLTLQLRAQGVARRAAVEEAGIRRLRPILMTALTTIFGMLPVALKIGKGAEIRAPMAIAVIGGLALSTLLTLIIIPVTYTVLDDWFPASSDSGDSQPTSG